MAQNKSKLDKWKALQILGATLQDVGSSLNWQRPTALSSLANAEADYTRWKQQYDMMKPYYEARTKAMQEVDVGELTKRIKLSLWQKAMTNGWDSLTEAEKRILGWKPLEVKPPKITSADFEKLKKELKPTLGEKFMGLVENLLPGAQPTERAILQKQAQLEALKKQYVNQFLGGNTKTIQLQPITVRKKKTQKKAWWLE